MLFTVVNHIQESHFLKFHPEILPQTWHASPDDLHYYCYVLEELFNVSELFIKKIGLKKVAGKSTGPVVHTQPWMNNPVQDHTSSGKPRFPPRDMPMQYSPSPSWEVNSRSSQLGRLLLGSAVSSPKPWASASHPLYRHLLSSEHVSFNSVAGPVVICSLTRPPGFVKLASPRYVFLDRLLVLVVIQRSSKTWSCISWISWISYIYHF